MLGYNPILVYIMKVTLIVTRDKTITEYIKYSLGHTILSWNNKSIIYESMGKF